MLQATLPEIKLALSSKSRDLLSHVISECMQMRGRITGADLGGGCRGCAPPPEMTCGFLIQLVFCKKKTMWLIGVDVEQETSAPPPKKNPGSAPELCHSMS